jgi:hypothetical protein
MLFCDLLRVTVLLIAGVATALGAVSVAAADPDIDSTLLTIAFGWWVIAALVGAALGRSAGAAEAMRNTLAGARTATSLPPDSPARIAFGRLWPIGAFALAAGALGVAWPQISAIGAGYAILTALAWRGREAAVAAIEERDGVRFYVEPSSALEPVKLVRTPGLYRDRDPGGGRPPPPPARTG